MNKTYINKYGEIVNKSFKDIKKETGKKISWSLINNIQVNDMSKSEKIFLAKYDLQPNIFNVANLRVYGYIFLYPASISRALKNGAIDKRESV